MKAIEFKKAITPVLGSQLSKRIDELGVKFSDSPPEAEFLKEFASSRRQYGKDAAGPILVDGFPPVDHWGVDEVFRIYLVLLIQEISGFEKFLWNLYQGGDLREQSAILKSLPFLDDGKSFVRIADDALKTNIPSLLAALVCENVFPARNLNEKSFNNMILKALFMEIPILTTPGLAGKRNAELSRIVHEWIDEREAANRDFTPEVWTLILPYLPDPGGAESERVTRYANGANRAHRAGIALALLEAGPLPLARARYKIEQDKEIKDILSKAISRDTR